MVDRVIMRMIRNKVCNLSASHSSVKRVRLVEESTRACTGHFGDRARGHICSVGPADGNVGGAVVCFCGGPEPLAHAGEEGPSRATLGSSTMSSRSDQSILP